MEKSLNIYQKINEVMKEVKYVQKTDKKVNNQYTFVSHDAVSAALHEPMARHGIVMSPTIAELVQDGNRTSVKMEIAFINADEPHDRFTVNYWGYGIDAQDKGIGKAVSYAVKYAQLKVFCLETGDDVEKDNIDHSTKEQDERKEVIESVKNQLIQDLSQDEKDWFDKYVSAIMQTMKLSYESTISKIAKKKDFKGDFFKWKEAEQRKVA